MVISIYYEVRDVVFLKVTSKIISFFVLYVDSDSTASDMIGLDDLGSIDDSIARIKSL